MAQSSSDVLSQEFRLFICWNTLSTQQIGLDSIFESPGPGPILFCALLFSGNLSTVGRPQILSFGD